MTEELDLGSISAKHFVSEMQPATQMAFERPGNVLINRHEMGKIVRAFRSRGSLSR